MIETQFTPFDYTTAAYERYFPLPNVHTLTLIRLARYAGTLDPNSSNTGSPTDWTQPPPMTSSQNPSDASSARSIGRRSTSRKRGKSSNQPPSLSGSPPMPSNHPPLPNGQGSSPQSGNYRQASSSHSTRAKTPLSPYQASYNRQQRPTGTRKESTSGGMQVTLDEMGSWSELAKQDATLPADAKLEVAAKPTGGMLSFLGRKKGRGHSPKPQERGILGKEGARVVISSGE